MVVGFLIAAVTACAPVTGTDTAVPSAAGPTTPASAPATPTPAPEPAAPVRVLQLSLCSTVPSEQVDTT